MKARHKRNTGGVNEAEEDLKEKPEARTNAKKIDAEAEERKNGGKVHGKSCRCGKCMGGRAGRKHGGHVHHEKMENMKHAKHVGEVRGEHGKPHAGRKPRMSGGRTGADSHPFSSARHGSEAPGHKVEMDMD